MKKREFSEAQKQALKLYWENGTPLTPADYPFFHFGVYVSEEAGEVSQGATIQLDLKRVDLLGLGNREFSERHPLQAKHLDQIELWRQIPSGEEEGQYNVLVAGTTFFWSPNGFFACIAEGKPWAVLPLYGEGTGYAASAVCQAIIARNEGWNIEPPDELRAILASDFRKWPQQLGALPIPHGDGGPLVLADVYPLHTSQEADALVCSASDGKRGSYWRNERERELRIWEQTGFPHRVELARGGDDKTPPASWEALEQLTGEQDGDFALALFYVAGVLCPAPDTGRPSIGKGWIDLNDVMAKIGWLRQKPNAAKTEELRRKLWRFLVFGEEARVVGARSVSYKNPQTGASVSTRIESPVWKILDKQMPEQTALFEERKPVPVAVHIAVSQQFEQVFTDPAFAQFMPLGELLGAIPPNKVGGDWARVIGLTLARIWRCNPRETKAGTLRITRHDVLTHFAPKTQTVQEVLSGPNPKRAVDYYREALQILLETGLIAPEGDAAKEVTPDKMLEPYGRQGWSDKWLFDACGLQPGPKWAPVIDGRAKALPPAKPRDLTAKKQRKPRTKKAP